MSIIRISKPICFGRFNYKKYKPTKKRSLYLVMKYLTLTYIIKQGTQYEQRL